MVANRLCYILFFLLRQIAFALPPPFLPLSAAQRQRLPPINLAGIEALNVATVDAKRGDKETGWLANE